LPFTAPECFFAVIIVFALIGLQQGLRRVLVLLVFALAGLVFLVLINGGPGLAHFVFVRAPVIVADIFGQPAPNNSEPSLQVQQITTVVAFVVILILGYIVGNRMMPKPATPADRIFGLIPGVATGFVVILFINRFFSTLFTVAFETPNASQYFVWFIVIAVIALVAGLIMASVKKAKK
jgi:hypothetical protein